MSDRELLLKVLKKLNQLEREIALLTTPKAQLRGRLMTVKDVMVYLGCCKNSVYKNQEALGVIRTPGGLRFKQELVELFLNNKRGKYHE